MRFRAQTAICDWRQKKLRRAFLTLVLPLGSPSKRKHLLANPDPILQFKQKQALHDNIHSTLIHLYISIIQTTFTNPLKDIRAHCYCASLVRTLFIRHTRATSFSCACTKSKTQQNIELMTFALTWCVNIFVTPLFFFRQISSFFVILSIILKNKKNLYVGSFNYFSYTIHIGWNWYMNTAVRDLEVEFF